MSEILNNLYRLLEAIEIAARDGRNTIGYEADSQPGCEQPGCSALEAVADAGNQPVSLQVPATNMDDDVWHMQPVNPVPVALRCQIYPHARDILRVSEIIQASGERYTKLILRSSCWDASGKAFAEWGPSTDTPGLVAAAVIAHLADGRVVVEVSEGGIIAVNRCKVVARPV